VRFTRRLKNTQVINNVKTIDDITSSIPISIQEKKLKNIFIQPSIIAAI